MRKEVIEKIKQTLRGNGVDRTKYPEQLKGSIAKDSWDDGLFTLGIEYGYIIALIELFDVNVEEVQ